MESHVKQAAPEARGPQVGQVVWFVPAGGESHLAAMVANVNEDGTLNLCVFTPHGQPTSHSAVPFVRHEDDAPDEMFCCLTHAEGKKPKKKQKK